MHRGTCDEPNETGAHEIGQLEGPVAEAVIDVPIADLVAAGYVLDVHLPQAEGREAKVLACAELAEAEEAGN